MDTNRLFLNIYNLLIVCMANENVETNVLNMTSEPRLKPFIWEQGKRITHLIIYASV